jgi:hypothetical protein
MWAIQVVVHHDEKTKKSLNAIYKGDNSSLSPSYHVVKSTLALASHACKNKKADVLL